METHGRYNHFLTPPGSPSNIQLQIPLGQINQLQIPPGQTNIAAQAPNWNQNWQRPMGMTNQPMGIAPQPTLKAPLKFP
jgi:hypothetical protein